MTTSNRPASLRQFISLNKRFKLNKNSQSLYELHNARTYKTRLKPLSLMAFIGSDYDINNRPTNIHLIPIGASRPDYLQRIYDSKKKNYTAPKPCYQGSYLDTENMGRYSSRCKYTRYVYTPMIQSYGYLVNSTTLYFKVESDLGIVSRVIRAPRGFHFRIDHLGIKIQSNSIKSMDYHFDSLDLLPYSIKKNDAKNSKELAKIAKDNYAIRKANDLKDKLLSGSESQFNRIISEASKANVYVCLVDSIKAGNCISGSESWVSNHGLESSKHYPVSTIASKLNALNKSRVARVILHAIERSKQELTQGFSILENHYRNYYSY